VDLIKQLGFVSVTRIKHFEKYQFGEIQIEALPALDIDVDSIFHIKIGDINILNVVDSWIDPSTFAKLKAIKWDLVLWPFQVMREYEVLSPSRYSQENLEWPPEWKEQLQELDPKAIVPSSCQFRFEDWSWYNRAYFLMSYQQFNLEIKELLPQSQVIRLDPGHSLKSSAGRWSLRENDLPWIQCLEPAGDYSFSLNQSEDMKLSFIARKLGAVATRDEAAALDYINSSQIIEEWQGLYHEQEGYFYRSEPVVWQLKTFASEGSERSYYFTVKAGTMERASEADARVVGWLTEIAISRLVGAMFYGESLTSLYIRINDCRFDEKKEKALLESDLLEDPLLRLLYEGKIGSYQKAQLERLLINNSF